MPTMHQVTLPSAGVTCHAWNADKSMLALCPNDNKLYIYEGCNSPSFSSWRLAHVLEEHDLVISGISWSTVTNKIVTCSHDRNAFVWTYSAGEGKWNPTLCALKLDRAALDVHWCPNGSKFAVGSGSKMVAVSRLDSTHGRDWYVSKLIKKHKSSVVQVAWHPNSQVLATACTDFKCRVVSASVDEVDGVRDGGPCGPAKAFGDIYHEFSCGGWVTSVAWSPSGNTLAFAGQDSTVHLVRFGQGAPMEQTVPFLRLPVVSLLFLSERALLAGGHDMNPLVFSSGASGHWSFLQLLDDKAQDTKKTSEVSQMAAARAKFQAKTVRGQSSTDSAGADLSTQHSNAITTIQPMGGGRVSTSGLDGRLVIWELPTLNIDMAALGL